MRRFAPVAPLFLLALPAMAARQVALVIDGELAQPARHGLAKLQEALRAKGFDVTASGAQDRRPMPPADPQEARRAKGFAAPASAAQADYVILAGPRRIGHPATVEGSRARRPRVS